MNRLQGKSTIITGAGQGIGKATALAFAREGARVLVAELDEQSGAQTARELTESGATALFVPTDVTSEASVQTAIAEATSAWGSLDVLVNNAATGSAEDTDVVRTPQSAWEATFAGTLYGVVYGLRHGVPAMLASGGGSIVSLASNAMFGADEVRVAYAAAKSALTSVSNYTAGIYGPQGVRSNVVSPGILSSPTMLEHYPAALREKMQQHVPSPRMGTPEDAAALIVYLASDESTFINGQTVSVDGGLSATSGLAVELALMGAHAQQG